jgi:betaine-aldehyde dehydrogenase
MTMMQSINPSNYQVLGEIDVSTPQMVADAVSNARTAQKEWRNLGLKKRIALLTKVFEEFEKQKDEFTILISREMGMPISVVLFDFEDSLNCARWYLDNAEKYLSPETTFEDEKTIHQVFYEPIGVSGIILPWNFVFAMFVWGSVQSLIAGNTVVLKHSEECPLSGKYIEDVISKFLPKGVFNEVYGDGEVGKLLIEKDIDMIAFTGSTNTGKYLYETAGKKFIKAVMELGGSAPGIVFDDADIDSAVESICFSRLFNTGQCCDGLKRLIVHESIFDTVIEKVASSFAAKKIGVAEDKETEIGPLVAKRQLELLIAQLADALEKGATIVTGGHSLEEKMGGAFFEPTLLTNITHDMRVWNEEVFGPILPVVTFTTEDEAVTLANQTVYGLGSYVFTQDQERARRISDQIETGMVSVNGTNYVSPCNPFGGWKNSGIGRENGKYGFHEVTQVKVVAMNK